MILTGQAIKQAYERGEITIDPFNLSQLNPNSYNYRLSGSILQVNNDGKGHQDFERIELPASGFVLRPKTLYLAATHEIIGSTKYVVTLLGRSSVGRLGLFLNVTADLGHAGSISQWTLELRVVQPLKVYPYMLIGQLAFWKQWGSIVEYRGRYHKDFGPVPNQDTSLLSSEDK